MSTWATMSPLLSKARTDVYLNHYGGRPAEALALYTWNAKISAAFWGPLGVLEVVLRNALHAQLVERCKRTDWWNDSHVHLCPSERRAIDDARNALVRRGHSTPSADDVVASTSFGLWVNLLGAGISRDRLYSYETALWQPRLRNAFPYRGAVSRKQLHGELLRLKSIRNRIAHHEPVFRSNHSALRDLVLDVLGYIHPAAADYVATHEQITAALVVKRASIVGGRPGF